MTVWLGGWKLEKKSVRCSQKSAHSSSFLNLFWIIYLHLYQSSFTSIFFLFILVSISLSFKPATLCIHTYQPPSLFRHGTRRTRVHWIVIQLELGPLTDHPICTTVIVMASDRRSSLSSIRSAISRTSMGSNRPGSSQRPSTPPTIERRPPSPLTTPSPGVPTLAPPAIGKAGLPPPMTPQRRPVQRQKSPLSAEAFSSPSAMPGAFPDAEDTTPSTQAHGKCNLRSTPSQTYGSTADTPDSTSRNSKRLSSLSKFLPMKNFRRSYDASSPQFSPVDDSQTRPKTPGGESMASSNKPSLRKRVSGTFFRRKSSSLGTGFIPGDNIDSSPAGERVAASPTSPRTNGFGNYDTIEEDSRPSSPTLADSNSPIGVKKRNSSTFWRRTSSLTLTQTMNAEKQGWSKRKISEGNYQTANGNSRPRLSEDILGGVSSNTRSFWGPNRQSQDHTNGSDIYADENVAERQRSVAERQKQARPQPRQDDISKEEETKKLERNLSEKLQILPKRKFSDRKPLPAVPAPPPRKHSPPPQIPDFVGGGSGLGLDDWLQGF